MTDRYDGRGDEKNRRSEIENKAEPFDELGVSKSSETDDQKSANHQSHANPVDKGRMVAQLQKLACEQDGKKAQAIAD